jgi:Hypothetical glycosyl hydrolase family 15
MHQTEHRKEPTIHLADPASRRSTRRPHRRCGVRIVQSAVVALTAAVTMSCSGPAPIPPSPPNSLGPTTGSMCGFWYGIGDSPTLDEINNIGDRYGLVVLNAWETDKMAQLRKVNPGVTVLVYKDLSSTRTYEGAIDGDTDADYLPSGIGFVDARDNHPDWFARDDLGRMIEWSKAFPDHWQMAVWDTDYQEAWAQQVTDEAVAEGWDGILADNDLATLSYYSDSLLAGTSTVAETDSQLRDGIGELITVAGERLNSAGKILIPNITESRYSPGMWTAHSRFGGGMDEFFALPDDSDAITTFEGGAQWDEMLTEAQNGQNWLALITQGAEEQKRRVGFATAALLAGTKTCWMAAGNNSYKKPEWTIWQQLSLGQAQGQPARNTDGTWTRSFSGGWVAVNPSTRYIEIEAPTGLHDLDGESVSTVDLEPGDAVVLVR